MTPKRVNTIARVVDQNRDDRSTISKTKPHKKDSQSTFDARSGANSENTANDVCWIFTEANIPEQSWRDATDFEVTRCLSSSDKEDQRMGDVMIC